mmetsp:Transcript_32510/g.38874  ORF Transcript_32510/g.38874 Transcript_32510/m.38874 type:complete len:741 (+) Transcript_32510:161-2383(+)
MSNSVFLRAAQRIGSIAKTSFALATIGVFGGASYQYNELAKFDTETSRAHQRQSPKKVLILPFHRMKLVERKENSLQDIVNTALATSGGDRSDDETVRAVEIRELVNTIHAAAEDPSIVSLFGCFGQGFEFEAGGLAHIEELRTAIQVFNESRRMHHDDDESTDDKDNNNNTNEISSSNSTTNNSEPKKRSFAFADTFENPSDSCNKEFFLASAFSQVHLQSRGNMNLFGVSLSSLFLKGALDKYGIKAHVFKHGKYKNAPNTFTERGYTYSHLTNTRSLVESLNSSISSSIIDARHIADNFDDSTWKSLHDYGTMTAENAREIGLIDHLTNINPLADLLSANTNDESLSRLQTKWGNSLNFDQFHASESVSYHEYVSARRRMDKVRKMKWRIHTMFRDAAGNNDMTKAMFSMLGYEAPYFNVDKNEYDRHNPMQTNEKIALLHITGSITDAAARKAISSLRKIKNDTDIKCIVLRIDSKGGSVTASETILEEFKDVPQPIVCSFSNYAASGGYYIATHSEKIFALPTTLTGSIGVFGIKVDATEFGRRHGINVEHVTSGKHALTYAIFDPLTKAVKMNLLRNVDRIYSYFKEIVADGRKMSLQEVEEVAQGRVWTGKQARDIGLVDELGGIDHAISYAMKKYATTGSAHVEVWPQRPSMEERIKEKIGITSAADKEQMITSDIVKLVMSGKVNLSTPMDILLLAQKTPGVMLTMDEDSAINFALNNSLQEHPDKIIEKQ